MHRITPWLVLLGVFAGGCSIKKVAVNRLGDALAGGGTTFASDDDPDLIRDALPFSLKLMESLLAENPKHKGLLLAAASGFTQYAFAFIQQEADEIESQDFEASLALKERARRMYLRARNFGLRGLEVYHPGFEQALRATPSSANCSSARFRCLARIGSTGRASRRISGAKTGICGKRNFSPSVSVSPMRKLP
jgi:hypothetical protein